MRLTRARRKSKNNDLPVPCWSGAMLQVAPPFSIVCAIQWPKADKDLIAPSTSATHQTTHVAIVGRVSLALKRCWLTSRETSWQWASWLQPQIHLHLSSATAHTPRARSRDGLFEPGGVQATMAWTWSGGESVLLDRCTCRFGVLSAARSHLPQGTATKIHVSYFEHLVTWISEVSFFSGSAWQGFREGCAGGTSYPGPAGTGASKVFLIKPKLTLVQASCQY